MGLKDGLSHVFNRHTALAAACTALNVIFAYKAAPSAGALLPLALAAWSANSWKQNVTGTGLFGH